MGMQAIMDAGCGLQGLSSAGLAYTPVTAAAPHAAATGAPAAAAPAAASLEETLGAQGAAVCGESSGSDTEMGACPRQGGGAFGFRQAAGGALLP